MDFSLTVVFISPQPADLEAAAEPVGDSGMNGCDATSPLIKE